MSSSSRVQSGARPLLGLVALLPAVAVAGCGSTSASQSHPDGGSGSTSSSSGSAGTGGTTATGTGGATATGGESPDSGTGNADAGVSNPDLPRSITVTNSCSFTVWADALPSTTLPGGAPLQLDPGQTFVAGVDNGWSGRVWGRFDCTTGAAGKVTCADDPFPSTLAELTLSKDQGTGLDFYDVSLVDGFDLPMALIAVGFTVDPAHPFSCGAPTCAMDLRPPCPTPLQDVVGGKTLACANDECKVLGNSDPTSPDCIYPNQYTEFFKTGCPRAYSFPSDDPTSTFTCKGKDYHVVFCP